MESDPESGVLDTLGPDELTVLQSHMQLRELLTLRMTSKASRVALDASAPPAVAIVHWILDQKLVNLSKSYNEDMPGYDPTTKGNDAWIEKCEWMKYQPTMEHASTRVLMDAFDLLRHATDGIRDGVQRDRFNDRWLNLARLSLCGRACLAIGGNGGGHSPPMNDAESVALLDDLFGSGFVYPEHSWNVYNHVYWNLFILAAVQCKIHMLRYMAERSDINVHCRALGGNNAYAIVCDKMERKVSYCEDNKHDFPSEQWFDNVRPGETYAQYVARVRSLAEAKYKPVLAYLRDELGLNTRPMRCDTPSHSSFGDDTDSEHEYEDDESESEYDDEDDEDEDEDDEDDEDDASDAGPSGAGPSGA
jgi:hypothetical protein